MLLGEGNLSLCDSHQKPLLLPGRFREKGAQRSVREDFPLCLSWKFAPAALERAKGIKKQFDFLLMCKERGLFFWLVNAKINVRRKGEKKFDLL